MHRRSTTALTASVLTALVAACSSPGVESSPRTAGRPAGPPETTASATASSAPVMDPVKARQVIRAPHAGVDHTRYRLDPDFPPTEDVESAIGVCPGAMVSDGLRLVTYVEYYVARPGVPSANIAVTRTVFPSPANRDDALLEAKQAPQQCATVAVSGTSTTRRVVPTPAGLPARTVTVGGTGTAPGRKAWAEIFFVVPVGERSLTVVDYIGRVGSAAAVVRMVQSEAAAATQATGAAEKLTSGA